MSHFWAALAGMERQAEQMSAAAEVERDKVIAIPILRCCLSSKAEGTADQLSKPASLISANI